MLLENSLSKYRRYLLPQYHMWKITESTRINQKLIIQILKSIEKFMINQTSLQWYKHKHIKIPHLSLAMLKVINR